LSSNRHLKREILYLLFNKHLRLTPTCLKREIFVKFPNTRRRAFRSALKALLNEGQITYTQHFSTTHIEINYYRPFKVSDRIVLSPKEYSGASNDNNVVIKLNDGASFGMGDHPTTRMMLRAIDFVLNTKFEITGARIHKALDIGTGSGVLAIAAAALGVEQVEAIDIDPTACHEAKNNIHINGCDGFVNISQSPVDVFFDQQFELLMANLRPPTLIKLIPSMIKVSSPKAVWIISGCRKGEEVGTINQLPQELFKIVWQEEQNNWSALALKKSALK
jgi:ribosomal protein L11 methyltransferase